MDFLVFGDDFGRHPSTTQHLVRALPASDRVLWVDSLGTRSPRVSYGDLARITERLRRAAPGTAWRRERTGAKVHAVSPRALPFHGHRHTRALNRLSLAKQLRCALAELDIVEPHILVSNPTGAFYFDLVDHASLIYLRLDDYAQLPGIDVALVREAEERLFVEVDLGFATARRLLPDCSARARFHLLEQGVDLAHFGRVRSTPGAPVLGFFGLLAEWIDWQLVEHVALLAPAVTLEFVGPGTAPPRVRALKNVRFIGAVAYDELPGAISRWTCAWIPFLVNDLTRAVNPLKAREYLAAGLACASTALPEVQALREVVIVRNARDVAAFCLASCQGGPTGTPEQRRAAVAADGWDNRAKTLRDTVLRNMWRRGGHQTNGQGSCSGSSVSSS